MHVIYEIFVLLVLGIWYIVSVLGQLSTSSFQWIRRWDKLGLIPSWSFFAPHPIQFDYHLLYRDQLRDKILTDWIEVCIIESNYWWYALWNPNRRKRQAFFDAIGMLVGQAHRNNSKGIQLSVPYLLLLNYVSDLPHHSDCVATQFLLIISYGIGSMQEPSIKFLSSFHQLKEEVNV